MPLKATGRPTAATLIQDARIDGRRADLRCRAGRIAALAERLEPLPGETCISAAGGALLPGLHDHHLHLFSLAAARSSLRCGPPAVRDRDELRQALERAAPRNGWIRGYGYHEEVAGPLDRRDLDEFRTDTPLRIQHRSGAMWILNSAALRALGDENAAQLERSPDGTPSGRLYRADDWLQQRLSRLGDSAPPSLAEVSSELARYGVSGLTDATPANDAATLVHFRHALTSGALQQRLLLMGSEALPPARSEEPRLATHSLKIALTETALPAFESLVQRIVQAHRRDRPVAIHCVTRAELVLALEALREAGCSRADRIEHASIAPPECVDSLRVLGVSVVTQPSFVRERGDSYLRDVAEVDVPWLYRCRGLLDSGVPLAGGTDAPYGDPDPWLAMAAALDRQTELGSVLQAEESLDPESALALFTGPPLDPGGRQRTLEVGADADLCLLDRSWERARGRLDSGLVRATLVAGEVVYLRDAGSGS